MKIKERFKKTVANNIMYVVPAPGDLERPIDKAITYTLKVFGILIGVCALIIFFRAGKMVSLYYEITATQTSINISLNKNTKASDLYLSNLNQSKQKEEKKDLADVAQVILLLNIGMGGIVLFLSTCIINRYLYSTFPDRIFLRKRLGNVNDDLV